METKFNEKDSLELITQMIENTKNNFSRNMGNHFIVWGITTIATALIVLIALKLSSFNPLIHWLWFLNPIAAVLITSRFKKQEVVKTKIDSLVSKLFANILTICCLIPLIIVGITFGLDNPSPLSYGSLILIPFLEIFVVSIGIAISGSIIDFRALRIGGMVGVIISFSMILPINIELYITIFAVWSLVTMVIPGVKLNLYAKRKSNA